MSHTHTYDPNPPSFVCVRTIFKDGPRLAPCGDDFLVPPPPPAAILPSQNHDGKSLLVTGMTVLGSMLCSVLLLCIFFVIVRFYFNKRINDSRRRSLPVIFFGTRDDIWVDELDYPMWYINTVGLQQSVIDSITVFKYRKDEGLIEGTECSVCLNEFEEDESLRLLPKCSHGFHVPCIDTWLRSHKNCPLCRAPVVCETMAAQTSDENDETRVEIHVGEDATGDQEIEDGDTPENAVRDFDGIQGTRRSVSLDLCSAIEIGGEATAGHKHGGSLGTEFEQLKYLKGKISGKRSCSSIDKLTKSSSSRRSLSMGPVSMKRSLSSGGIFFSSKRSKSQESILPL